MSGGWWIALWLAMHPHGLPTAPAPKPPPAAAAATARALAKAVETSAKLAALPKRAFGDPRVPDILQPGPLEAELDRTLHRQIGDFVEAWLREHGADAPTDRLEEELRLDLLWGVTVPRRLPFEGDVRFAVVRPADDSELLAVAWTTHLVYLNNSSVYVFTTGGGRVERVLEWSAELAGWPAGESPGVLPLPFGPTDVLNHFDFRLSARDERGDFYVAAVWTVPSPASSWSAISWVLLESGSDPRSPRVLARGSDGVWECYDDDCYDLAIEDGVVTLDYTGSPGELAICNGYTSGDLQRVWRLADGRAEELGSPGNTPFSFVSDWIDAPWRHAREWGARGAAMREWHRLLKGVACRLEPAGEFVDHCPADATRREVLRLVVGDRAGDNPSAEEVPRTLFFLIENGDALRLLDITQSWPDGEWQDSKGCDAGSDAPR